MSKALYRGEEFYVNSNWIQECFRTVFMAQLRAVRIHSSYFINSVAESMEQIHADLFRLVTELQAVRCQGQTECNALRDLFARTTTAMSSSGSQHDRRLNHSEAGGSRFAHGHFFDSDGGLCGSPVT